MRHVTHLREGVGPVEVGPNRDLGLVFEGRVRDLSVQSRIVEAHLVVRTPSALSAVI